MTARRWTPPSSSAARRPSAQSPGARPTRRQGKEVLPRNVKITLMVLFLFFVGEYILLPELASAAAGVTPAEPPQRHLADPRRAVGGGGAGGLHAADPHGPLPWRARPVRIFRINMWALAISHTLPGGHVPGTAASYKLLTEADVSGSTAAFGLATQGIGSAVVLNVIFWLALLISIPLQGYNPLYGFAALLGVLLLAIFAARDLLPHPGREARRRLLEQGGRATALRAGRDGDLVGPEGGRPDEDPLHELGPPHEGRRLGGGQLAARLRLALGLPPGLRRPRRPDRHPGGLRAGQHLGRHPDHAERSGRGRDHGHRHSEGLRRPGRRGGRRRPDLAPGQLLAAHPLRWRLLPVAALRALPPRCGRRRQRRRQAPAGHRFAPGWPTRSSSGSSVSSGCYEQRQNGWPAGSA